MKKSFDFRDPRDDVAGSWAEEDELPGFRDFAAADFHQACVLSLSALGIL